MPDKTTKHLRLQSVLTDWQQWRLTEKPGLLKTFTAGLNHQTHLIKAGATPLILKLYAGSHRSAIAAQRWAAGLGIAPAVLYAAADCSYALFDYLDVETLTAAQVDSPSLQHLATALKTMHAANADGVELGDFELLRYCEQYLHTISKALPQLAKIHQQLLPALTIFLEDPSPWCVCHNDLVAENCFIVNDQAQFIDWEYAQRHNPWFDLAAVVFYLDLSPEQAALFLQSYFLQTYQDGQQQTVDTPIFYASQCALLWVDMLWHLDRNGSDSWHLLRDKWVRLQRLAGNLDITL